MLKKYILPVLLLFLVGFYIFRHFYKKSQISKQHYGVKANSLRQKLYIPIIDDHLVADELYSGTRWASRNELPVDDKVLHVWKIITPLSDTAGLNEESDAFRKKYNDSLIYQLNIHSKIIGDTLAFREGRLFFYNRNLLLDIDLTDENIDSIASSWKLTNLIRRR